jgi:hypothetical protein
MSTLHAKKQKTAGPRLDSHLNMPAARFTLIHIKVRSCICNDAMTAHGIAKPRAAVGMLPNADRLRINQSAVEANKVQRTIW